MAEMESRDSHEIEVENKSNAGSELLKRFNSLYSGSKADSTLFFFLNLNFIFTILRFHDFSGMGFLGTIRLPALISMICIFLSIPKLSQVKIVQFRIMLGLLFFELCRGVTGYLIIQSLVLNDGWQMHILGDLCLTVFSVVLPIVAICKNGLRLRKILSFLLYAGMLLGIWSITHSGHGPGGYLGDENDNCLVLVYLLPIPFFLYTQSRNFVYKIFCIFSGLIVVLGAIFTNSRGGFLGLIAVIFFQFLLSRNKIKWIASAVLVCLLSLPFIPDQYWKEVYSIGTDSNSSDGTIRERLDTWGYITRMWLDPSNTVFGTGLENGKWNLYMYEDAESGHTKKSLAGRAAHCLYFQVLGDLGIWGVLVFGGIILNSIKQLRLVRREAKNAFKLLHSQQLIAKLDGSADIASLLRKEITFLDGISSAILCSWLGALTAAVGISVAYYPTIWFLSGLSMAIYLYWLLIRDNLLTNLIAKSTRN